VFATRGRQTADTLRTAYRGTSLIKNNPLLGPYSRTMNRALWWSWGKGLFFMSEVFLHTSVEEHARPDMLRHKGISLIRNSNPF